MTDILKFAVSAKMINDSFGLSNSMAKIIQSNQRWADQVDTMTMNNAVLKGISLNQKYYLKSFSNGDLLIKSIELQQKFAIPDKVYDLINSINKQQNALFGSHNNLFRIAERQGSLFSKVNSLHFAMAGISNQVAAIAAKGIDWELLEEFEKLNEAAIELTNGFTEDTILTEEQSLKFQNLVESIIIFYQKNKNYGKYALIFLTIILNLMSLHQYYDFIKTKPEPATKKDFIIFEKKIRLAIEGQLNEQKELRVTNRKTKVMLKPKTKTIVITVLPKNFEIIVLQINHKWTLVSYSNPKDNLMETGWVLKKYLDKQ